eukprot:GHVN01003593.1.p1 GENE.GHVN01003593.1~~GHVN01003593.1.p1  ORF type:complete len:546 (-),score=76.23 GHVN01003593.1:589-2226(-)
MDNAAQPSRSKSRRQRGSKGDLHDKDDAKHLADRQSVEGGGPVMSKPTEVPPGLPETAMGTNDHTKAVLFPQQEVQGTGFVANDHKPMVVPTSPVAPGPVSPFTHKQHSDEVSLEPKPLQEVIQQAAPRLTAKSKQPATPPTSSTIKELPTSSTIKETVSDIVNDPTVPTATRPKNEQNINQVVETLQAKVDRVSATPLSETRPTSTSSPPASDLTGQASNERQSPSSAMRAKLSSACSSCRDYLEAASEKLMQSTSKLSGGSNTSPTSDSRFRSVVAAKQMMRKAHSKTGQMIETIELMGENMLDRVIPSPLPHISMYRASSALHQSARYVDGYYPTPPPQSTPSGSETVHSSKSGKGNGEGGDEFSFDKIGSLMLAAWWMVVKITLGLPLTAWLRCAAYLNLAFHKVLDMFFIDLFPTDLMSHRVMTYAMSRYGGSKVEEHNQRVCRSPPLSCHSPSGWFATFPKRQCTVLDAEVIAVRRFLDTLPVVLVMRHCEMVYSCVPQTVRDRLTELSREVVALGDVVGFQLEYPYKYHYQPKGGVRL